MFRAFAAFYILAILPALSGEAVWHQDMDIALEEAKKTNRPILLFFTGSDWCKPCQKLKAEVLDQAAFQKTTQETFILAEIDFPENTEQDPKIADQNRRLAELYHIEGYPTIVLISASGRPFWIELGAVSENPGRYARELISRNKSYQKFVKFVRESKQVPTPLAAAKLASGLEILPAELVPRHYRRELKRLTMLDPKDLTGFRKRLQFADDRAKINAEMTKLFLNGNYAMVIKRAHEVIKRRAHIFSKTDLQMLHLRCSMANLHLKDFDAALREIDQISKIDPNSRVGKQVNHYKKQIEYVRQQFHAKLKQEKEAPANDQ